MLRRAVLIWLCIVPVAIINGLVRDLMLVPMLGDPVARAVSCLALAGAVLLIARASIRWIAARYLVTARKFPQLKDEIAENLRFLPPFTWSRPCSYDGRRLHMSRRIGVLALASIIALSWLSLSATSSAPLPTTPEDDLLRNATLVFERAVDPGAAAIPASVLIRARAIAVFPRSARYGSGYSGRGVLSARGANPSYWTPPAVIAFEGTVPLDLESDAVDFVLVAQTPRGLDYLIQPQFVSPVVLPIVPGALGQDTRVRLDADLLGYMQFGDYFAGITIRDWSIREMRDANARLYGRPYSTEDIVRGVGFFHLPPAARSWRGAIAAYFREMS